MSSNAHRPGRSLDHWADHPGHRRRRLNRYQPAPRRTRSDMRSRTRCCAARSGATVSVRGQRFSIDGAAMGDTERQNQELGVLDRVDHSAVADSMRPQAWVSNQRSRAWRPGLRSQAVDGPGDPPGNLLVKLGQLLQRPRVVLDRVRPGIAHRSSARPTSSAGTGVARPASRSVSRSVAMRPSSRSTISS